MSYSAEFWTFSKKDNSTKQPTVTGTVFTCEVADGSGMLAPTIKLHTNFADPSGYNYCRIAKFNRYYFVRNWRYDRGLWWADLSVDVLASWKTNIGNFTGYVLRAAGASDGNIKDAFYPAKTTPEHYIVSIPLGWEEDFSDGEFVVGIINGDTGTTGSVNYYVMSIDEFRDFCYAVYDNTGDWLDTANINDISEELLKTLFNPFEYVVSCMWFPFAVPVWPAYTVTSIPLGWWSVPVSAKGLLYTEQITMQTFTVAPQQHPQAATRGNYLNSGPYTTLTLTIPPFGNIPLDASLVCGDSLDISIWTDYISGSSTLYVKTIDSGTGTILYCGSTQTGVPIQISGRQPNIASLITGAIASFVDALPTPNKENGGLWSDLSKIGHDLLGIPDVAASAANIQGAASGIANAAASGFKRLASVGSNGSRAQISQYAYLSQDFMLLVDENNAEFGRPLYQTKQISTLSGYIQMGDANIEIPALESEKSMISKFLLSGFFYE